MKETKIKLKNIREMEQRKKAVDFYIYGERNGYHLPNEEYSSKLKIELEMQAIRPMAVDIYELWERLSGLEELVSEYTELSKDHEEWEKLNSYKEKYNLLYNRIEHIINSYIDKEESVQDRKTEIDFIMSKLGNYLTSINNSIEELKDAISYIKEPIRVACKKKVREEKEKNGGYIEYPKALYGDIESSGNFIDINNEVDYDRWIMELNDRYTNNY